MGHTKLAYVRTGETPVPPVGWRLGISAKIRTGCSLIHLKIRAILGGAVTRTDFGDLLVDAGRGVGRQGEIDFLGPGAVVHAALDAFGPS